MSVQFSLTRWAGRDCISVAIESTSIQMELTGVQEKIYTARWLEGVYLSRMTRWTLCDDAFSYFLKYIPAGCLASREQQCSTQLMHISSTSMLTRRYVSWRLVYFLSLFFLSFSFFFRFAFLLDFGYPFDCNALPVLHLETLSLFLNRHVVLFDSWVYIHSFLPSTRERDWLKNESPAFPSRAYGDNRAFQNAGRRPRKPPCVSFFSSTRLKPIDAK